MHIHTYQPKRIPPIDFTRWLQHQYGSLQSSTLFLRQLHKAYAYCIESQDISFLPLTAYLEGKLEGHCALIQDRRLPTNVAFFGFLELANNKLVFEGLWQRLCNEARALGVTVLKGPISGSIWHQYRCVSQSDGSPEYMFEPQSKPHYVDFLRAQGPQIELGYHSAYRQRYDDVLALLESAASKSADAAFKVQLIATPTESDFAQIADLSKAIFQGSWGYTPLSPDDFLMLYPPSELRQSGAQLYMLYAGSEAIGFCAVMRSDKQTLICKTIAILPQYHRRGLGTLLAYTIHRDAKQQGITKIIYALVRDDNSIQHFPSVDLVTFRRYAAFEFVL